MKKEIFASVSVLGVAVFASSVILANAQTDASGTVQADTAGVRAASSAPQEIVFPVAELGNCTSKENCRTYCNNPDNMDACIAFAKAHGIMNKDEAERADNFKKILRSGGGPGGCKGPEECRTFCADIKNIDVCVRFAKSNKLNTNEEELNRAEKLSAYIKTGGQLPGGCTSKETCESYCKDFNHVEECFNFAEKAGIKPPEDRAKDRKGAS